MTTPTASPAKPIVKNIAKPSQLRVCDRCGADALWMLVYPTSELLFCGHHAVKVGLVNRADSHVAYATENKTKGSDH